MEADRLVSSSVQGAIAQASVNGGEESDSAIVFFVRGELVLFV